ncbi:gamma-glutamyl-gamma-aminobutyrate hydrolase family protein [Viridibacillus sp. YIM B01967]|uniref:Gamma-glutamyl-gamma-aminobutyrate hydrolase family protein n=1 Tax=Viridibacillus soli TaxID=2798301 RepID=A0ABS1HAL7_9BACL|nr:gamma-glutamyl-gamma-aminobutyrate hydrolase family protein [Viridibacillus soli]MBK3496479.1 gamma-glutamyl-gamma-aminobutyrate hydrolase family protein [Viridibacillus soli]
MKPVIGISTNLKEQVLSLSTDNIAAITKFGGLPIVLPNLEGTEIDSIVELIDGLLLTGGGDIDPTLFGEEPRQKLGSITPERDLFEIAIIKKMLAQNKPILGICRGAQILNIAVGGDMFQDIYSQTETKLLQHVQQAPRWHATHFVQVMESSLLKSIAQMEKFKVNSFHHQAIRKIPYGFEISAIASDGIIEAFESENHQFVMGLQWHPECMLLRNDQVSAKIMNAFINACQKN